MFIIKDMKICCMIWDFWRTFVMFYEISFYFVQFDVWGHISPTTTFICGEEKRLKHVDSAAKSVLLPPWCRLTKEFKSINTFNALCISHYNHL